MFPQHMPPCFPMCATDPAGRRPARTVTLCCCDDDAERLDALMAEGIDQRTASLMLWAPDQLQHREAS